MNAAMEAKSSRNETAKLETQERERRMALLLIFSRTVKQPISRIFISYGKIFAAWKFREASRNEWSEAQ